MYLCAYFLCVCTSYSDIKTHIEYLFITSDLKTTQHIPYNPEDKHKHKKISIVRLKLTNIKTYTSTFLKTMILIVIPESWIENKLTEEFKTDRRRARKRKAISKSIRYLIIS